MICIVNALKESQILLGRSMSQQISGNFVINLNSNFWCIVHDLVIVQDSRGCVHLLQLINFKEIRSSLIYQENNVGLVISSLKFKGNNTKGLRPENDHFIQKDCAQPYHN